TKTAADSNDVVGNLARADSNGFAARHGKRSLRAIGTRNYWRIIGFSRGDGVPRPCGLSLVPSQRRAGAGGGGMRKNCLIIASLLAMSFTCWAQMSMQIQSPMDAPLGPPPGLSDPPATGQAKTAPIRLSVKDAELIALKNNPAISEARLNALASQ